ncbi:hypothetical protein ACFSW8_08235 [Rubritalea tangerina]|uniref:Uncharacterized protein n=1 Tax=Rubritalea tangerina TaxID=430798 RepID=A0ABW4ZBG1_9BACT
MSGQKAYYGKIDRGGKVEIRDLRSDALVEDADKWYLGRLRRILQRQHERRGYKRDISYVMFVPKYATEDHTVLHNIRTSSRGKYLFGTKGYTLNELRQGLAEIEK